MQIRADFAQFGIGQDQFFEFVPEVRGVVESGGHKKVQKLELEPAVLFDFVLVKIHNFIGAYAQPAGVEGEIRLFFGRRR